MKKLMIGFLAALVLLGSVAWSHAWGEMRRPGFTHRNRPFVHRPAFVHRPFPHHDFRHHHFGRSRAFVGAGFLFPVVVAPPVVFAPATPVYVQPPPQPTYWYYCESAQTYYPYIQQCPDGWLEVVPQSPAP
jgi:hypothetical protein